MSGGQQYDGFLSYARRDKQPEEPGALGEVARFHAALEVELKTLWQRPCHIFFDRDISSGKRWREVLEQRLNEVSFMVCMLSPRFFASMECREEVNGFVERALAVGHEPKLYPVIIQDVSGVPQDDFYLSMMDRQFVDLTQIRLEPLESPAYREFITWVAQQIAAGLEELRPQA
ncbi:MAG: TIR domain-containing protein [Fimbriimonas sp.]